MMRKTEFNILETQERLSQIDDIKITIGQDLISCSTSVKSLSFHMDQYLKNYAHINKLSSNLYQSVKT